MNDADNSRCDVDTCVGLSSGTAGLYQTGDKQSGMAYNVVYSVDERYTMFDLN